MCDGFSIFRFLFYVSIIRLSVCDRNGPKRPAKAETAEKADNEKNDAGVAGEQ